MAGRETLSACPKSKLQLRAYVFSPCLLTNKWTQYCSTTESSDSDTYLGGCWQGLESYWVWRPLLSSVASLHERLQMKKMRCPRFWKFLRNMQMCWWILRPWGAQRARLTLLKIYFSSLTLKRVTFEEPDQVLWRCVYVFWRLLLRSPILRSLSEYQFSINPFSFSFSIFCFFCKYLRCLYSLFLQSQWHKSAR